MKKLISLMFVLCFLSLSVAHAKSWKSMFNSMMKPAKTSHSRNADSAAPVDGKYLEIQNPPEGNHGIHDFEQAKKLFKQTHYFGATKTVYCGCPMTSWNTFTTQGCGYVHDKYESQWTKIEAEHLVPVSQIVSNTRAYKQGEPAICGNDKARKCAGKVYGFLFGDAWILAPAEMELNRVHSNYQWEELGGQGKHFGTCDFTYADRKVQPGKDIKGMIARAYMYVQDTYKVKVISGKNEKLYAIWAKYPPTKDQCVRAHQIVKIQGNQNKFEIQACKDANLW